MGKRLKCMTAFAAVAVCAVLALAGCSSSGEEYTPQAKSPQVSSPTIGQDGTLRVGVDTSNSPLAGMSNSKIIGLDVDVAAALADSLGLKLSIVDVGSDPASALSDGKVDIVLGVDKSGSSSSFWRSDVYLPTGVALLSLSETDAVPAAGSGAKFAAQVSSRSAWAVMNIYGEESLTSTNSLADAFTALSSGSVQYVASDAVVGIYAAYRDGISVYPIAFLQQPGGYCIGVADGNDALKTTISDAVATMTSNGVISVIEKKWLGASLDFSEIPQVNASSATTNDNADEAGSANATVNTASGASASASSSSPTVGSNAL